MALRPSLDGGSVNGDVKDILSTLGVDDKELNGEGDEDNLNDDSADDLGADDSDEPDAGDDDPTGEDDGSDEDEIDDLSDTPRERVSHTDKRQQPKRPAGINGQDVRSDAKGNLVDAQGNIVARAGREAKVYQRAFNAGRQNMGQRAELQRRDLTGRLERAVEIAREAIARVQEARENASLGERLGLDVNETTRALQLAAEMKKDPKEGLKKLLTMAAAQGIDVQNLGLQGGIDPKSLLDLVRQEIQGATRPLAERNAADRQTADYERRFQNNLRNVESFFAANPDAVQYGPAFHAVLQDKRFRGMTLEHIWDKIRLNLLRRGAGGSRRPSGRRPPNGRGRPMSGEDRNAAVDPRMSYDAIIRDLERDFPEIGRR